MPQIPSDFPPLRPLENPSQTEWGKNAGVLGLLLVGGIYTGVAPLMAGVTGSALAVKKIQHFIRAHFSTHSAQFSLDSQKVKELSPKQLQLIKTLSKQSEAELTELLQESEDKIFAKEDLNDQTLQVEGRRKLKKQMRQAFTSTFSLIPFVGVAAAAAYLKATTPDIQDTGVHGAIEALSQQLFEGRQKMIQGMLYPLNGKTLTQRDQMHAQEGQAAQQALPSNHPNKNKPIEQQYYSAIIPQLIERYFHAKETPIVVERGDGELHHLHAYTYSARRQNLEESSHHLDLTKPTVVIFHGNAQLAEDMFLQAKTYVDAGFNVVTTTMGGYPGSDESTQTSEASTYQDAHAVMNYLKSQGVTEVIVHGTSIGGSLAFAAAELHPDLVKVVVADQTFNRAKDVAANLIRNTLDHGFIVPSSLVRGAVGAGFPVGEIVPGVYTRDGAPYLTDGLNNARKAATVQAEVIAIKSSCDTFMGRIGDQTQGYQENFADDLIRARYPQGASPEYLIPFNGEHCAWLERENEEKLLQTLKGFFVS